MRTSNLKLSGTIYYENGETLDFQELISLIFILEEGAEAIPQNVTEWPEWPLLVRNLLLWLGGRDKWL